MNIMGIVLAAGQGKRMKSKLYKVLHPVCGKPMVGHVVSVLEKLDTRRTVVIVGHGAEAVKGYLGDRAEYALQAQQLGTGHAVLQARDLLGAEEGTTVVICGDTPLISEETLQSMIRLHGEKGAAATILTAVVDEPKGYGRILRDERGLVSGIVEEKDCSEAQRLVQEVNTGTYCFDNRKLFEALSAVKNENVQGEYYLTDVIGILAGAGEIVEGYAMKDAVESIGVNDRLALSVAETAMRERINRAHMLNGVTFIDASSTYIEADVTIGADTVILPGTVIRGRTTIGEDCILGPQADIQDSTIAGGVEIKHSVLLEAVVGAGTTIGPFAYLRPGAELGENVKIGDFVEIKNAKLANDVKVSHLSYIGDAVIGRNVNFGCGAITVNYDGFNKQLTEVEEDAFVGSNVNLIAPVKIGKGAYVVAGSTITTNVEAGDLAIARERQVNKPGYADKLRARFAAKKAQSKKTE
ncbi:MULTISPECIES: bifunctional UDP-N-acetylglucosamine diphosphorylase/glucosamine-1-phosphate N-acetyltransferase GlmU [Paenibacillus]|uniref:bifunctional UDP-N-acetylglucosamine diphosphorylase/glucosamine-1-phosphate N-acetyltransferase GlmU n=1 Tax=Paenibacillus TaxID=44249 RepID=UPI0022B8D4D7|nr:bifunctional UDP-N-acetylglucosamine diphosphorylase/glucosamine-1-phosphate N-acetyltransferase GlmU [Paenibacillus caseinilyticus]MCZ8523708.1 bifunctional UDP-N-acetylglucosamine diphosphorylase/glucosamine-1-phosphate N-acetyltransferase GlmU [Paenibacillus caseinilyticus]